MQIPDPVSGSDPREQIVQLLQKVQEREKPQRLHALPKKSVSAELETDDRLGETEGRISEALDAGGKALGGMGLPPLGQVQSEKYGPLSSGLMQAFENRIPGSSAALIGDSEQQAKNEIISRESSGKPEAKNPKSTAFGLGQLIVKNREHYAQQLGVDPWTVDPEAQSKMMDMYVADRYGTYENALKFHNQNGWY